MKVKVKAVRFISALLCATLLAGCGSGAAETGVQKEALIPDYGLDSLGIYANCSTVQQMAKSGNLQAWNDYMSEKYNTPVTLTNDLFLGDDNIQIKLQNASEIYQSIKAGTAIPLEAYLADNETWKRLPDDFKKRFEYDGHIYAIPRSNKNNLKVSCIRSDWLKQAGKSMPYTTDELVEAGKAFGESQVLIGTDYALHIDLLNAFGLYLSDADEPNVSPLQKTSLKGYYSAVAYDPELECYADCMFKDGAVDAITYFKNMVDSGLISKDAFWGTNSANVNNGDYGLIYGRPGEIKYRIDEVYEALPPLSEEHPVTYSDDDEGYTVSPKAENPGAAVNMFVDMMFGSVKNYLDFACGVPENYTFGSNRVITVNYTDEATKTLALSPRLADCDELILGEAYIIVNPEQDAKAEKKIRKQIRDYEQAYITKYTENEKLVKIPVWFSVIESKMYLDFKSVPYSEFLEVMISLANPEKKAAALVEHYQISAKEYCRPKDFPPVYTFYPQMLQNINSMVGLEFKQDIPYKPK